MDDVTVARALHIASVVLWIGGVGFVTTVLLPAVRRFKAPSQRMELFDQIERRFAWQARISTVVVGLTGFYVIYRLICGSASSMAHISGCTLWWPFGCSSH